MTPAHPLFIIRHGETDWNRERRFQGRTDIEMNDTGIAQARANGRRLASFDHDWNQWIFAASPLTRTRRTMELIREEMGLDPNDYIVEDALIEITFGDWERQTLADLTSSDPELMAARDADKWHFVPPNGEAYAHAVGRVRFVIDGLDRPAVLVTHGGVIRAARVLIENLKKILHVDLIF